MKLVQDAECHHERGNGKKRPSKYYFSVSVSRLDGIFDVVYGGIKENKSIPIFLQSDPRLTPSFSPTPLFASSFTAFIRDKTTDTHCTRAVTHYLPFYSLDLTWN